MSLEAFVVFEGEADRVEVPDDDGVVLGPGGQPPSVRGPLGVPHFLAVVGQGLDGLAGKVLLGALVVHRQEAGVDLERGAASCIRPSIPVGGRGRQAERRVGQARERRPVVVETPATTVPMEFRFSNEGLLLRRNLAYSSYPSVSDIKKFLSKIS